MHLVAVYLAAVYTSEGMSSFQISLVAFSFYHLAQVSILTLVEVFALSLSIHPHTTILRNLMAVLLAVILRPGHSH